MESKCKVLKLSKKFVKKYPSKFLQEKHQAMIHTNEQKNDWTLLRY